MNVFNDPKFIALIGELKSRDPEKFMDLVFGALKEFPDFAVEDDVPAEVKLSALERVRRHFETREEYERCAFIRDLQKKIEDGEER